MKKVLGIFLAVSVILSGIGAFAETASPMPTESALPQATDKPTVSAEPTDEPSETESPTAEPTILPTSTPAIPEKELSTQFVLDIDIIPHKYIIPNDITVELYNNSDELLGSITENVSQDTSSLNLIFNVPQYRMGETFKVKLASGLRSLRYYDKKIEPNGILEVQTYGYLNENGEYVQNNGCAMNGNPNYDKELCMYVNGNFLKDISPGARMIDGIAMMPVRAIGEAMGLKVTYDKKYDSVVCSVGSDQVIFNANSAYTTIFGNDTYAPHATIYIDGSLFVPVRTLAESFNSSIDVLDFDDHLDIIIGESPMVKEYRNQTPVNKNGITSRTNYLVWVSKHEYKVRVYQGSQYNWELQKEFPCALGAWNTPTITGQFEFIERTQWNYSNYYVGPVLRFHNGYALHSTLLYYNGTEYDGRVGVNISHGCIRLHPSDINWIADTIPFYTRIYITE